MIEVTVISGKYYKAYTLPVGIDDASRCSVMRALYHRRVLNDALSCWDKDCVKVPRKKNEYEKTMPTKNSCP